MTGVKRAKKEKQAMQDYHDSAAPNAGPSRRCICGSEFLTDRLYARHLRASFGCRQALDRVQEEREARSAFDAGLPRLRRTPRGTHSHNWAWRPR